MRKNSKEFKVVLCVTLIFVFCILYIASPNLTIPSSSNNSDASNRTKEITYKDVLDSNNVTALEYIEIEKEESSFFLTLTENGVNLIELEPSEGGNWRMSGEYVIDNTVLEDYLDVHGLYWDTILLSDDTLLIYGICNADLNIQKIKTIVSSRNIYEYNMEEDRRLFFVDLNDKNPSKITVQGMNDETSVVAELFRSKYWWK